MRTLMRQHRIQLCIARCIAHAKKYEAAGCDILLCLVNPYDIPHDKVMQTIELLGKYVIPEFGDAS